MARGITEQDVHAAADALVEAGERPTVERIRAHLGTGSPNTVTRYLESWWVGLGGRLASQRASASLPAAPTEVVDLASRWWEAALSASRSHIESEMAAEQASLATARATLAADAEALQSRLKEGLAAASQAEQARIFAEQRSEDLTAVVAELRLQLTRATTLLDAAEARASRLQDEHAGHLQQLQKREIDLSKERRLQAEHLRGVEDRANMEIDRARRESRELKKLVDAGLRAKQAADERHRVREEALQRQLAEAQRDAAVARAEASALRAALKPETANRVTKKPKATTTEKRATAPSTRRKTKATTPKSP